MQYINMDDTVYFWFGANDTSGSGGDGATPLCDIRLAGAAASAAPVYSPTPALLTNAGYSDGCHEVAIAATSGNGFAAGNVYAVFCTLTIDSQNPTGFVGAFKIAPVLANAIQISDDSTAADNCELMFDGAGYAGGTTKLDVNIASSNDIDLSATQKASVNTEVDSALDTAIPASPTAGSINDELDVQKDAKTEGLAQTGTLSTTVMTTNLSEVTDDHYNGRVVVFRGGVLDGQATSISDYSGTNGTITMIQITEAPVNNQAFTIF